MTYICPYPIADLLPHRPPMILLDEVLDWSPGQATAAVEIHPGIPFFRGKSGVPAHVGLEYMAQTCGIYAGLESLGLGLPVRMGFLLGTRNYNAKTNWFQSGDRLLVSVKEVMRQESMGVFDCNIIINYKNIASAQLTVYQSDSKTYIP